MKNYQLFWNCLSKQAFLEKNSLGRISLDRDYPFFNSLDNIYFLDKNKIIQSKAYRRIGDKTQVFSDEYNNIHIRNRLIHTSEAVAIGIMIAKILGLNQALVESILLVHDIGHTPFGHLGENRISLISGKKFKHSVMSIVIAQKVERSGAGMNLSFETLEGGLYHSREDDNLEIKEKYPLEYGVGMLADKISYVFSDLNDALSCGYLTQKELPDEFFFFGKNQRERISNLIFALAMESCEENTLSFNKSEAAIKFKDLRSWSYENFYRKMDRTSLTKKINEVCLFMESEAPLFGQDYLLPIALMTDKEINRIYNWLEKHPDHEKFDFRTLSYYEILRKFPEGHFVDIFNADLDPKKFENFKKSY